MNWKIRVKNPVFWVQFLLAVATPVGAYFGLQGADVTNWAILGQTLLAAVKNPYVLALVAVSVWNCVNDPTTKGVSDSETALSHDTPG